MNLVAMIGNTASDPDLRHTPAGRAVCTFRVAINRPGGEQADFFTVTCWERQAEIAARHLTRGSRVGVEGRLHQSTWQDDTGAKRSKVEIIAHRINLLSPRQRDETDASPATPENAVV